MIYADDETIRKFKSELANLMLAYDAVGIYASTSYSVKVLFLGGAEISLCDDLGIATEESLTSDQIALT
jgi:hypothetical protein